MVANGVPGPPDGPRPARPEIGERLRIVYLGRLSERKGVHLVVDAVGALQDLGVEALLDLVGDIYPGYEWFEKQLHDAVADAGIRDRVRFRGFHADVWPWLEAADVVVVPSVKAEPFGNTAVEAVLAARPVIVADHSGLREAVAGFRSAQFVNTRSADAVEGLVDALVRVRSDWDNYRAAALVDEAVARARHRPEEFGWHVAAAVMAGAGREPRRGRRSGKKAAANVDRGKQRNDSEGEREVWTQVQRNPEWAMRPGRSTSST